MIDRNKLLDQLKKLSKSQFEELVFRLDIEEAHLRTDGVTLSQTAIDFIKCLEQEENGLARLKTTLDELAFFKEFLPDGAYPVGRELLEREEAREQQAMQAAEARGENPEDYRVTPEKFYTFRPEADWLGVFRDWDAPRSFHKDLIQTVISCGRNNCPAAAIIGPGGSGKSVALRRLAVELVNQGQKVWWVEEPERLLRFGLSELADTGEGPHFLLIDEIQSLEDEDIRRFKQYLQKHLSLVLVVAGRSLPRGFRCNSVFHPNEVADRISILEKIAEVMPAWAETARQLEAESLREARLIRILIVLARRQEPVPRTLEELEAVFLDILVDDLKRIRSTLPGLAEAVMDAAAMCEVGVGYSISRKTLIALAEYHQPGAGIPTFLAQVNSNPRWQSLAPLLSLDPEYDTVRFHHDELAEGLLLAGQQELLEPYVDDAWRKVVLDLVINRGCKSSSSYALYGFVRKHRDLITKEQALGYIRQLLSAENGHHAYLTLIVDEALSLKLQERLNLLLSVAPSVPTNSSLWQTVWLWIQHHYQSKEERGEILQQLYQSGCQDSEILNRLLQCRPPQEARNYAKEWLAERTTHPHVLCSCLKLLGEEAKDQARQLLDDPTTSSDVLCRCLELLGEEAKDQARQLLEGPTTSSDVLCRCLELLGEEAKDQARQLLDDPTIHPHVLCRCLELLGEEAKDQARQLLDDPTTSSDVQCRCLELLGEEAKDQAKLLLEDPTTSSDVLCRCLELLGEEAKDQAKLLLADPTTSSEVLCRCLELLGEEAKDQARQLLDDPTTSSMVLCRCLELLGEEAKDQAQQLLVNCKDKEILCRCLELLKEEAKPFATERIRYWTETEANVLVRCFQIAGETPEAQKAADEMLAAWDKRVPPSLRVVALRAPFDTPFRTQRAREILDDWHRQYRPLVAAALMAFWNNPDAVTRDCRAIISRWRPEIVYRHKNKKRLQRPDYDGHIIKALFHPALRKEASQAAQAMLYKENYSPGFLSPELHR